MFKKSFIFFLFFLTACGNNLSNDATEIISTMPLEQKIGQMMMVGIPGKEYNNYSKSIIEKYLPGGIILFGHNIGTKDETEKLIQNIQRTAFEKYKIPVFISIDQEGGRVIRITDGVTRFPGNMSFGVVNDKFITEKCARITGTELRSMGINMNLTPVLDVNNNPGNPVINTRSFGSDPDIVASMGKAYIKGMKKSLCIPVAKHFPGHGDTNKDSHKILPVVYHDIDRLRKVELKPFQTAVKCGVDAIMTAHISFPNILKNDKPATLSEEFLNGLLRREMGFKGLVITDDLEMNAVSEKMDIGEVAVESILAGADIILISSYNDSMKKITEALKKAVNEGLIPISRIDDSVTRILGLKLRYKLMKYENKSISVIDTVINEKKSELSEKADELNAEVSGKSIYYYSNNEYTAYNKSDKNIFISSDRLFIFQINKELGNSSYNLFANEKDCIKYIKEKIISEKNTVGKSRIKVYYQFNTADKKFINDIFKIQDQQNIELVLLCTGNPFLLNELQAIPPVYISFSNTDESFRQLILCLNGDFKPRLEINVNLGLNKIKK